MFENWQIVKRCQYQVNGKGTTYDIAIHKAWNEPDPNCSPKLRGIVQAHNDKDILCTISEEAATGLSQQKTDPVEFLLDLIKQELDNGRFPAQRG